MNDILYVYDEDQNSFKQFDILKKIGYIRQICKGFSDNSYQILTETGCLYYITYDISFYQMPFRNEKINYIVTNSTASIAMSYSGNLYSFGDDPQSQGFLGIQKLTHVSAPLKIGSQFKQISLSESFACGLDNYGKVWNWGTSPIGKLDQPTQITITSPGKFTKICAAKDYMLLTDVQSQLYIICDTFKLTSEYYTNKKWVIHQVDKKCSEHLIIQELLPADKFYLVLTNNHSLYICQNSLDKMTLKKLNIPHKIHNLTQTAAYIYCFTEFGRFLRIDKANLYINEFQEFQKLSDQINYELLYEEQQVLYNVKPTFNKQYSLRQLQSFLVDTYRLKSGKFSTSPVPSINPSTSDLINHARETNLKLSIIQHQSASKSNTPLKTTPIKSRLLQQTQQQQFYSPQIGYTKLKSLNSQTDKVKIQNKFLVSQQFTPQISKRNSINQTYLNRNSGLKSGSQTRSYIKMNEDSPSRNKSPIKKANLERLLVQEILHSLESTPYQYEQINVDVRDRTTSRSISANYDKTKLKNASIFPNKSNEKLNDIIYSDLSLNYSNDGRIEFKQSMNQMKGQIESLQQSFIQSNLSDTQPTHQVGEFTLQYSNQLNPKQKYQRDNKCELFQKSDEAQYKNKFFADQNPIEFNLKSSSKQGNQQLNNQQRIKQTNNEFIRAKQAAIQQRFNQLQLIFKKQISNSFTQIKIEGCPNFKFQLVCAKTNCIMNRVLYRYTFQKLLNYYLINNNYQLTESDNQKLKKMIKNKQITQVLKELSNKRFELEVTQFKQICKKLDILIKNALTRQAFQKILMHIISISNIGYTKRDTQNFKQLIQNKEISKAFQEMQAKKIEMQSLAEPQNIIKRVFLRQAFQQLLLHILKTDEVGFAKKDEQNFKQLIQNKQISKAFQEMQAKKVEIQSLAEPQNIIKRVFLRQAFQQLLLHILKTDEVGFAKKDEQNFKQLIQNKQISKAFQEMQAKKVEMQSLAEPQNIIKRVFLRQAFQQLLLHILKTDEVGFAKKDEQNFKQLIQNKQISKAFQEMQAKKVEMQSLAEPQNIIKRVFLRQAFQQLLLHILKTDEVGFAKKDEQNFKQLIQNKQISKAFQEMQAKKVEIQSLAEPQNIIKRVFLRQAFQQLLLHILKTDEVGFAKKDEQNFKQLIQNKQISKAFQEMQAKKIEMQSLAEPQNIIKRVFLRQAFQQLLLHILKTDEVGFAKKDEQNFKQLIQNKQISKAFQEMQAKKVEIQSLAEPQNIIKRVFLRQAFQQLLLHILKTDEVGFAKKDEQNFKQLIQNKQISKAFQEMQAKKVEIQSLAEPQNIIKRVFLRQAFQQLLLHILKTDEVGFAKKDEQNFKQLIQNKQISKAFQEMQAKKVEIQSLAEPQNIIKRVFLRQAFQQLLLHILKTDEVGFAKKDEQNFKQLIQNKQISKAFQEMQAKKIEMQSLAEPQNIIKRVFLRQAFQQLLLHILKTDEVGFAKKDEQNFKQLIQNKQISKAFQEMQAKKVEMQSLAEPQNIIKRVFLRQAFQQLVLHILKTDEVGFAKKDEQNFKQLIQNKQISKAFQEMQAKKIEMQSLAEPQNIIKRVFLRQAFQQLVLHILKIDEVGFAKKDEQNFKQLIQNKQISQAFQEMQAKKVEMQSLAEPQNIIKRVFLRQAFQQLVLHILKTDEVGFAKKDEQNFKQLIQNKQISQAFQEMQAKKIEMKSLAEPQNIIKRVFLRQVFQQLLLHILKTDEVGFAKKDEKNFKQLIQNKQISKALHEMKAKKAERSVIAEPFMIIKRVFLRQAFQKLIFYILKTDEIGFAQEDAQNFKQLIQNKQISKALHEMKAKKAERSIVAEPFMMIKRVFLRQAFQELIFYILKTDEIGFAQEDAQNFKQLIQNKQISKALHEMKTKKTERSVIAEPFMMIKRVFLRQAFQQLIFYILKTDEIGFAQEDAQNFKQLIQNQQITKALHEMKTKKAERSVIAEPFMMIKRVFLRQAFQQFIFYILKTDEIGFAQEDAQNFKQLIQNKQITKALHEMKAKKAERSIVAEPFMMIKRVFLRQAFQELIFYILKTDEIGFAQEDAQNFKQLIQNKQITKALHQMKAKKAERSIVAEPFMMIKRVFLRQAFQQLIFYILKTDEIGFAQEDAQNFKQLIQNKQITKALHEMKTKKAERSVIAEPFMMIKRVFLRQAFQQFIFYILKTDEIGFAQEDAQNFKQLIQNKQITKVLHEMKAKKAERSIVAEPFMMIKRVFLRQAFQELIFYILKTDEIGFAQEDAQNFKQLIQNKQITKALHEMKAKKAERSIVAEPFMMIKRVFLRQAFQQLIFYILKTDEIGFAQEDAQNFKQLIQNKQITKALHEMKTKKAERSVIAEPFMMIKRVFLRQAFQQLIFYILKTDEIGFAQEDAQNFKQLIQNKQITKALHEMKAKKAEISVIAEPFMMIKRVFLRQAFQQLIFYILKTDEIGFAQEDAQNFKQLIQNKQITKVLHEMKTKKAERSVIVEPFMMIKRVFLRQAFQQLIFYILKTDEIGFAQEDAQNFKQLIQNKQITKALHEMKAKKAERSIVAEPFMMIKRVFLRQAFQELIFYILKTDEIGFAQEDAQNFKQLIQNKQITKALHEMKAKKAERSIVAEPFMMIKRVFLRQAFQELIFYILKTDEIGFAQEDAQNFKQLIQNKQITKALHEMKAKKAERSIVAEPFMMIKRVFLRQAFQELIFYILKTDEIGFAQEDAQNFKQLIQHKQISKALHEMKAKKAERSIVAKPFIMIKRVFLRQAFQELIFYILKTDEIGLAQEDAQTFKQLIQNKQISKALHEMKAKKAERSIVAEPFMMIKRVFLRQAFQELIFYILKTDEIGFAQEDAQNFKQLIQNKQISKALHEMKAKKAERSIVAEPFMMIKRVFLRQAFQELIFYILKTDEIGFAQEDAQNFKQLIQHKQISKALHEMKAKKAERSIVAEPFMMIKRVFLRQAFQELIFYILKTDEIGFAQEEAQNFKQLIQKKQISKALHEMKAKKAERSIVAKPFIMIKRVFLRQAFQELIFYILKTDEIGLAQEDAQTFKQLIQNKQISKALHEMKAKKAERSIVAEPFMMIKRVFLRQAFQELIFYILKTDEIGFAQEDAQNFKQLIQNKQISKALHEMKAKKAERSIVAEPFMMIKRVFLRQAFQELIFYILKTDEIGFAQEDAQNFKQLIQHKQISKALHEMKAKKAERSIVAEPFMMIKRVFLRQAFQELIFYILKTDEIGFAQEDAQNFKQLIQNKQISKALHEMKAKKAERSIVAEPFMMIKRVFLRQAFQELIFYILKTDEIGFAQEDAQNFKQLIQNKQISKALHEMKAKKAERSIVAEPFMMIKSVFLRQAFQELIFYILKTDEIGFAQEDAQNFKQLIQNKQISKALHEMKAKKAERSIVAEPFMMIKRVFLRQAFQELIFYILKTDEIGFAQEDAQNFKQLIQHKQISKALHEMKAKKAERSIVAEPFMMIKRVFLRQAFQELIFYILKTDEIGFAQEDAQNFKQLIQHKQISKALHEMKAKKAERSVIAEPFMMIKRVFLRQAFQELIFYILKTDEIGFAQEDAQNFKQLIQNKQLSKALHEMKAKKAERSIVAEPFMMIKRVFLRQAFQQLIFYILKTDEIGFAQEDAQNFKQLIQNKQITKALHEMKTKKAERSVIAEPFMMIKRVFLRQAFQQLIFYILKTDEIGFAQEDAQNFKQLIQNKQITKALHEMKAKKAEISVIAEPFMMIKRVFLRQAFQELIFYILKTDEIGFAQEDAQNFKQLIQNKQITKALHEMKTKKAERSVIAEPFMMIKRVFLRQAFQQLIFYILKTDEIGFAQEDAQNFKQLIQNKWLSKALHEMKAKKAERSIVAEPFMMIKRVFLRQAFQELIFYILKTDEIGFAQEDAQNFKQLIQNKQISKALHEMKAKKAERSIVAEPFMMIKRVFLRQAFQELIFYILKTDEIGFAQEDAQNFKQLIQNKQISKALHEMKAKKAERSIVAEPFMMIKRVFLRQAFQELIFYILKTDEIGFAQKDAQNFKQLIQKKQISKALHEMKAKKAERSIVAKPFIMIKRVFLRQAFQELIFYILKTDEIGFAQEDAQTFKQLIQNKQISKALHEMKAKKAERSIVAEPFMMIKRVFLRQAFQELIFYILKTDEIGFAQEDAQNFKQLIQNKQISKALHEMKAKKAERSIVAEPFMMIKRVFLRQAFQELIFYILKTDEIGFAQEDAQNFKQLIQNKQISKALHEMKAKKAERSIVAEPFMMIKRVFLRQAFQELIFYILKTDEIGFAQEDAQNFKQLIQNKQISKALHEMKAKKAERSIVAEPFMMIKRVFLRQAFQELIFYILKTDEIGFAQEDAQNFKQLIQNKQISKALHEMKAKKAERSIVAEPFMMIKRVFLRQAFQELIFYILKTDEIGFAQEDAQNFKQLIQNKQLSKALHEMKAKKAERSIVAEPFMMIKRVFLRQAFQELIFYILKTDEIGFAQEDAQNFKQLIQHKQISKALHEMKAKKAERSIVAEPFMMIKRVFLRQAFQQLIFCILKTDEIGFAQEDAQNFKQLIQNKQLSKALHEMKAKKAERSIVAEPFMMIKRVFLRQAFQELIFYILKTDEIGFAQEDAQNFKQLIQNKQLSKALHEMKAKKAERSIVSEPFMMIKRVFLRQAFQELIFYILKTDEIGFAQEDAQNFKQLIQNKQISKALHDMNIKRTQMSKLNKPLNILIKVFQRQAFQQMVLFTFNKDELEMSKEELQNYKQLIQSKQISKTFKEVKAKRTLKLSLTKPLITLQRVFVRQAFQQLLFHILKMDEIKFGKEDAQKFKELIQNKQLSNAFKEMKASKTKFKQLQNQNKIQSATEILNKILKRQAFQSIFLQFLTKKNLTFEQKNDSQLQKMIKMKQLTKAFNEMKLQIRQSKIKKLSQNCTKARQILNHVFLRQAFQHLLVFFYSKSKNTNYIEFIEEDIERYHQMLSENKLMQLDNKYEFEVEQSEPLELAETPPGEQKQKSISPRKSVQMISKYFTQLIPTQIVQKQETKEMEKVTEIEKKTENQGHIGQLRKAQTISQFAQSKLLTPQPRVEKRKQTANQLTTQTSPKPRTAQQQTSILVSQFQEKLSRQSSAKSISSKPLNQSQSQSSQLNKRNQQISTPSLSQASVTVSQNSSQLISNKNISQSGLAQQQKEKIAKQFQRMNSTILKKK